MAEVTPQAEGRSLDLGHGETVELELELMMVLPTKAWAEVTWNRKDDLVVLRGVKYGHPPEPSREDLEPSVREFIGRATAEGSENPALRSLAVLPRPPWNCASCGTETNRLSYTGQPMCHLCKRGHR